MLTVACVLRSGGDFDAECVERLHAGVTKHLPIDHRFVCLSDVPVPCQRIPLRYGWPKWWAKMQAFHPDITGDVLYLDLDTVVVGDLSDIASVGRLTMLTDFYWPERPASGLMYLTEADRAKVWGAWMHGPVGHMQRCGSGPRGDLGDQKFLGPILGPQAARFQDLLPGQVVSYKVHVRKAQKPRESGNGQVPPGARLVCFHGKPRPRDVKGFW